MDWLYDVLWRLNRIGECGGFFILCWLLLWQGVLLVRCVQRNIWHICKSKQDQHLEIFSACALPTKSCYQTLPKPFELRIYHLSIITHNIETANARDCNLMLMCLHHNIILHCIYCNQMVMEEVTKVFVPNLNLEQFLWKNSENSELPNRGSLSKSQFIQRSFRKKKQRGLLLWHRISVKLANYVLGALRGWGNALPPTSQWRNLQLGGVTIKWIDIISV